MKILVQAEGIVGAIPGTCSGHDILGNNTELIGVAASEYIGLREGS